MPAPSLTVAGMVKTYLENRANFYHALLARLPEAAVHARLSEIAVRLTNDVVVITDEFVVQDLQDEFTQSLKSLDILKKSDHGWILGRTAISIEESLQRAMDLEEKGAVLFAHLAELVTEHRIAFAAFADRHQTALVELLQLHDELRYHRLSFLPRKP